MNQTPPAGDSGQRHARDLPQPPPPRVDTTRRCGCGAVLLGIDPPGAGRCRHCPPTPAERAERARKETT